MTRGNTQSEVSSSYSFDNIDSMETSLHEHPMGTQYDLPITSSDVADTAAAVGPDLESFEVDGDRMNPFTVRDSRTLTWKNVHMTLVGTKYREEKKLLDNVQGEIPERKTTAIMGASGAGKTSLLNVLAGRLQSSRELRVEAEIRINNELVEPTDINVRRQIAFVAQDDSLQVTATPREAIRFSARLRLSRDVSKDEIDQLTERMLRELGLTDCADTIVGGALIKGISGGERKRTSVGVELVTRPGVIFLDEPTSGLDSYSSLQCCNVLRKVAEAGASVLFTIHQPSSEIFESIDQLILMNKGRVMFQGAVKDMPDAFGKLGYPIPNNYNPADFVIDLAQTVSIAELEKAGFFGNAQLEAMKDNLPCHNSLSTETSVVDAPPPGIATQSGLLFMRELHHMHRDWTVTFSRVVVSSVVGLFLGLLFLDVGDTDKSERLLMQSYLGGVMIILCAMMIVQMQVSMFVIPDERPIFLREFSTNHYAVLSYMVSHLLAEAVLTAVQCFILLSLVYWTMGLSGRFVIHFLSTFAFSLVTAAQAVLVGCLAGNNVKLAIQMQPLLIIPQMLFSGFFLPTEMMPSWLAWLQHLCTMVYSARIMVVEEFENCSDIAEEQMNCDDIIRAVAADKDDVWWYWMVLATMYVVYRTLAVVVLRKSALRFY